MLDFDTMLMHVGEFGLYQKILFVFQAPFCIFVTFVLFGQLFMVLYPQNYWCEEAFACLEDISEVNAAQRRNISLKWLEPGLFQDACETNYIDDQYIKDLHAYDKRVCNWGNRTADCELDPRSIRSGGQIIPTRRPLFNEHRWQNIPPPPKLTYDINSTSTRAERQSYGQTRAPFWKPTSTFPTTTTTTDYPFGGSNGYDGEDRGGNGGQGEYQPNYYGSGNRGPGNNGGSSYQGSNSNRYPSTSSGQGEYGDSSGSGRPGQNNNDWSSNQSGPRRPGQNNNWNGNQGSTRKPTTGPSTSASSDKGQKEKEYSDIKFKDYVKSSRLQSPINSAYAGWPKPKCKDNKRFFMSIHPQANILAEHMKRTFPNNNSHGRIEHCKARWNRSEVPYETIVTEGNWWCNAEAYITISQAVFFLGAIVGGFLIGWIADTFGRVPALVIANILGAVGGALSAVSTNIYVFCVFRFITGMAFDNSMTMMYILVLEFCGPSYRTLVANLSIAIFYTLGTIILPIMAYYIGNWRIYALVISLPMLLALLALFFVPESARWLLSKGRAKEAVNILRNFAKVNRRKVEEHVFVDFEQEATKLFAQLEMEEEEPSLTAAFRTPRLRRTFMLLIIFWSLIALVYDGHSRNITNLANDELNVFWMFGIASMTEFPADMLLIFTLDVFGRRWLAFGSMTLSGAFSIIAAAITPEMRTGYLITAIISRFWVNVAFNIGLQYAAELLPTVIRAQGVNAIHIMGYVASIISPFVAAIGRSNPTLSLILLGAFALAAGITALFLAETLGEDLPNTLEEAEAFGKDQSFWNCPMCAREWDDDEAPLPPPEEEKPTPVMLRNALRGSIRGETYRSSMISQASSGGGGGGSRRSQFLRSGRNKVMQNPEPTEMTKLRRITH